MTNDKLQPDRTGDLRDRLEGLEFSLDFAQSLAALSPEREDLQERIEQLEAEISEVKAMLQGSAGDPAV